MANRYWVGGAGNWDATAGTKWATTSGGAGGAAVPTAADDVFLDNGAGTGNVTISAPAVCRSLNCTGYVNTLTRTSTLTIGDGTPGAGNIALKYVSGMTLAGSGAVTFASTSATVQTVDFGGKTTSGVINFNGVGGSWQYASNHTDGGTNISGVVLVNGTLDLNSKTCSWGYFDSGNANVRTLTMGSAAVSLNAFFSTLFNLRGTNLTVTANTSTWTILSAMTSCDCYANNFDGNGMSMVQTAGLATFTGFTITGTLTLKDFTWTGSAATTPSLTLTGNITCTGTLTLNGNSATNRLLVTSSAIGTQRTLTAATVSCSNVDFRDIAGAGAGSWDLSAITGKSGDCGGNSNITFTTGTTQTATGTAGFTWSTHGWTSRVPLPQDTASIPNSFSASQAISMDMPRVGAVTFSCTGSPTLAITTGQSYGSMTLCSGLGAVTLSQHLYFYNAAAATLTTGGKSIGGIGYDVISGRSKVTLGDAYASTGPFRTVNSGYLDTANYAMSVFYCFFGNTSNVNLLGTSVITITAGSSYHFYALSGNISAASATVVFATASTQIRTLEIQENTLGTLTYTVAGSTGKLVFSFYTPILIGTLNVSDVSNARTIEFTSGVTYAITNFNVNGTSGKLISLTASTPGSAATISKPSGTVSCDYLSVKDSTATGGATFYAGANSTNVSNNTGWIFTAPPNTLSNYAFGKRSRVNARRRRR